MQCSRPIQQRAKSLLLVGPRPFRHVAYALTSSSFPGSTRHFSSSSSSPHMGSAKPRRENNSVIPAELLPPVLPPPAWKPDPNNPDLVKHQKSLMTRAWNYLSIRQQTQRIVSAETLFQAATRQSSDPRWFGPGRVARDFRPRHALLTMHIWFLHKRLICDEIDPSTALAIQEELFNILWEDTTCRIRQAGVNELAVTSNLKKVQQYTFMHLTHYDHVYTEFLDQPHARLKELRNLVWRHILVRDEEAEHCTDQLDRIAWYIEANYQNIVMDWPDADYREQRVAWVDLPDFTGMKDANGKVMPDNPVDLDDVLPFPWLRNITLRGVDYYWNPETKETRWERPTE